MKPKKLIYLDHAAATPLDPRVLKAMKPYFKSEFANPSSLYEAARRTRQALDAARKSIAGELGAKPTEIVFTAGGTESVNLAIQGVMRQFPGSGLVTSAIEHEAVLRCGRAMAEEGNELLIVPVDSSGVFKAHELAKTITDLTSLVSVMLVNSEIGTIQPLTELASVIRKVRADRQQRGIDQPIYLHSDASQAAGALDLSVNRLGVDLLTLNGSKIYGPKQSGILYVKTGVELKPLIYGGGQERNLRSGTENVAGAVGLAEALKLAQSARTSQNKRLAELRDLAWSEIRSRIKGVSLNGDAKRRIGANLNVTFDGVDGESLVLYLDKAGFAVATGSACQAGLEPSHVLTAIGLSKRQAESSLRLTLGRATTRTDIDQLLKVLPGLVERLRRLA